MSITSKLDLIQLIFALKYISGSNSSPLCLNPNYVNEIRFSHLSHPNIIRTCGSKSKRELIQTTTYFEASYILMELALCDFIDLISFIDFRNDEKLVRTFFHQIVEGVEFIHSQGIYHMDLKLDNLLLGQDFMAKIADFDLALKKEDQIKQSKGTLNYRAPELIEGRVDLPPAADIYSLAIVLFALNTGGNLPYSENKRIEGIDFFKLLLNSAEHFWESYHSTANSAHNFSADFKELFVLMTRENPSERASIQEIKSSKWYKGPGYTQPELLLRIKSGLKKLLSRD